MEYDVTITNGTGSARIPNGTYGVTAEAAGYDSTTISPDEVTIVEGTDTYEFTIAATGTLTLHVTEDGTAGGTPVVGATFNRTDAAGTIYGDVVTTDASGNAVFGNVPFAATGAPAIYYKQISTAEAHEFDDTVASIQMTQNAQTVEITNALAAERTINLTDANYDNLPIGTATISFNEQ